MSRWHREHPDYQETGMQPPDPRDAWDMERKRQKEEGFGLCPQCGQPKDKPHCQNSRCKSRGLYACATCGEPVRHYGQRCERCKASIEEDRLNRGD